jgi:hypothetical protein
MFRRTAAFAVLAAVLAVDHALAGAPMPVTGTFALAPDPRSPSRSFSCSIATKIELGADRIVEHWRAADFGKDAWMPDGTNTCRVIDWKRKGDRIEGRYACLWKGTTPSPAEMADGDDADGASTFVIRVLPGDRIEYNAAAIFGRCP